MDSNSPPESGPQDVGPPASPSPPDGQTRRWWMLANFSHLVIWWVVMIGYYVVFNTLSGRYHKGLIDVEMLYDGWYVIAASGVVGALYAKQRRFLWFLISIALAMLMLLAMLLCLGALKTLMSP
jgi:hypothetical protein